MAVSSICSEIELLLALASWLRIIPYYQQPFFGLFLLFFFFFYSESYPALRHSSKEINRYAMTTTTNFADRWQRRPTLLDTSISNANALYEEGQIYIWALFLSGHKKSARRPHKTKRNQDKIWLTQNHTCLRSTHTRVRACVRMHGMITVVSSRFIWLIQPPRIGSKEDQSYKL